MKRIFSLLLSVIMVMSLFAACGNAEDKKPEKDPTTPAVHESSEEIFTKIWDKFTEDEQFPVTGGAPETYAEMIEIDENFMMPMAPAAYDMKYSESLPAYLYIPADQLGNLEEVAFAQHAMMINNFACGVLHVKEDAKGLAESMVDVLKNNQWLCGTPEKLLIAVIDANHILIGYGLEIALNPVATHLVEVYPAAEIIANEAIAG